jgi:hypothetical protein
MPIFNERANCLISGRGFSIQRVPSQNGDRLKDQRPHNSQFNPMKFYTAFRLHKKKGSSVIANPAAIHEGILEKLS